MEPTQNPHIVMIPSPGIGHLTPILQFARKIVHLHKVSVTFLVTQSLQSALQNLPQQITYTTLPPLSFPEDARIQTILTLTITRSVPFIRQTVRSLLPSSKVVALITDQFGTDSFDVAREFNIPPYIFFISSSLHLSFFLYLPKLDQTVVGKFSDLTHPVRVPGFNVLVNSSDLPDALQDRSNDAYKFFLYNAKRFVLADGIIVNGFVGFPEGVFETLKQGVDNPPVYPIGPLIRSESGVKRLESNDCLKWLDDQQSGSVLFVSFGSGGTLSREQFIELALGLEMSEVKFLWVVKSPDDKSASGSFFSLRSNKNPFDYLPEGFMDRIKSRGLLVDYWSPQVEILRHGSTGGFLTHCGWNSIVESVVNGVPMIAWPLFAEQKLNAVMLTDDLEVAIRPKANENGLIGREEIAKALKRLFHTEDGIKIRERMKKLKNDGDLAVSEDGSSTRSLSELVSKWDIN